MNRTTRACVVIACLCVVAFMGWFVRQYYADKRERDLAELQKSMDHYADEIERIVGEPGFSNDFRADTRKILKGE